MTYLVTKLFLSCLYWNLASAWTQFPPHLYKANAWQRPFASTTSTALPMSQDDSSSSSEEEPTLLVERVAISGVSVSQKGFHIFLETTQGTLPFPLTRDPQDAYFATSPESLTIIQLLSGVDMAGAILPPETLAKMVVYHCELLPDVFIGSPTQRAILALVQMSLPKHTPSFADAHPWLQSRIQLPQVTLDQLTLRHDPASGQWTCRLECALQEIQDRLTIPVSQDIVRPVCYNYNADTSSLFTCVALALRYKAPIVLEYSSIDLPLDLDQDFPQRTTVQKLQQKSTRVTQNIERGFDIHKLTGALQIAMKLGDQGAAKRIRAKLDEYDSMADLPTTKEELPSENPKTGNDALDDLSKNILQ